MSEVLKQLFSNDKADEVISAINSIGSGGNDPNEYARTIGLRMLDALDKVIWQDSSGADEIQALREAVYATPEPSQALPYGYVRYDYIEKYTGTVRNTYPLIRIKEYPTIYEKGIDITFGYSSLAGSTIALLGARNRSSSVSDNSRSFAFYTDKSGVFMHLYGSQTTITSSGVTASNNLIQYRPNGSGAVVTVNGVDVTVTGSYSSALSLLGLGVSANPVIYTDDSQATIASITGGARVGNIKIYDGDALIGNYVPCLRISDNVIGMYDTVDKAFYTAERLSYATPGNADCMWRAGEW